MTPNQEVVAETPDALTLFAVLLFALLLAPATVPGQVGVLSQDQLHEWVQEFLTRPI